jgi:hypothetical protein
MVAERFQPAKEEYSGVKWEYRQDVIPPHVAVPHMNKELSPSGWEVFYVMPCMGQASPLDPHPQQALMLLSKRPIFEKPL